MEKNEKKIGLLIFPNIITEQCLDTIWRKNIAILKERTFMSSFLNLLYIIISIYNIFAPAPVLEW